MKSNSKYLLALMTAILLTGCNNKPQEEPYHYESDDYEISFDYSFKEDLKNSLNSIYIGDNEEMNETNFNKFLSILSLNDFYANKVTYTIDEQVLYLEEDDETKVDGDYIKSTRYELKRNNQTDSLTGTVTIHDEQWNQLSDIGTLDHYCVDTSGTYSLTHSEESGVGKEIITCDNEQYSSTKNIGFSQQIWGNKMNLTQSEYIGTKFSEDYKVMTELNNSNPTQYKTLGAITCKKSSDSVQVTFTTTLTLDSKHDSVLEVTYYDTVKIAGGMIVETEHKRVEIDRDDTNEFVVKLEREKREISYELPQ